MLQPGHDHKAFGNERGPARFTNAQAFYIHNQRLNRQTFRKPVGRFGE
jgi:hypothetical protein